MSEMNALLRRYVTLNSWGQAITKEKAELRAKIQSWMEDRELTSVRGDQGMCAVFASEAKTKANYSKADTEKVAAWLHETGNGAIVERAIRKGDLDRIVSDMKARGEPLPEFIKPFEDLGFQVRSGKFAVPPLPEVV